MFWAPSYLGDWTVGCVRVPAHFKLYVQSPVQPEPIRPLLRPYWRAAQIFVCRDRSETCKRRRRLRQRR
jgi:hypothetical protein